MRGSSIGDSSSSNWRREALKKLIEDPILFSRLILGFKPFKYQEELLRDQGKRIIVCAGRQVGKSTTIAAKAIHYASTNPETVTLIVSATLRQSMLLFRKIMNFIDSSILRNSLKKRTKTWIKFMNDSEIIVLPCGRGHTLRGYSANLIILDEAAFMPEEVITNVILPMIAATDGSCWMISTPWDTDHIFYRIWIGEHGEWSKYFWPSKLSPLISDEFLEEQRKLIGEERFMIEYEANFIEERSSFFPMKLLRKCIEDYEPRLEENAVYGYDPGGRGSLAAIVGVKFDPRIGKWRLTFYRAERCESYIEFNSFILDLHRRARMDRLIVDETGIGGPIVEHLKELGLPVIGVKLTEKIKEEVLGRLKLMLEKGELILPNDPQLLNHLNCIQYERTWSGGFRFTHRNGTHDDLAYALALAVFYPSESFLI
ncbi:MAG TPA: hypothetical protein ENF33_05290 [Nitrososphaeria archaeon]|nr:hypothetical protein [Nitrososphaeria archaeon]